MGKFLKIKKLNSMPFDSAKQQRWAFATKQPFAKRWAAETPDFSALPEKKKKSTARYYALKKLSGQ